SAWVVLSAGGAQVDAPVPSMPPARARGRRARPAPLARHPAAAPPRPKGNPVCCPAENGHFSTAATHPARRAPRTCDADHPERRRRMDRAAQVAGVLARHALVAAPHVAGAIARFGPLADAELVALGRSLSAGQLAG